MSLSDIVLNYLVDNGKGMQHPVTGFLNDVMKEEVGHRSGVPGYARSSTRRVHSNGQRQ